MQRKRKINLIVKAGNLAYDSIKRNGLETSSVYAVSSAAGGPKWFTSFGLTKYIIGDLLRESEREVHFLGSSVGSWQMACALCADPDKAITKLRDLYARWEYSPKPDAQEISTACRSMIEQTLSSELENILAHPNKHLHILTSRTSSNSDTTPAIIAKFGRIALLNLMGRQMMSRAVERSIFSSGETLPFDQAQDVLPTKHYQLKDENYLDALQASGAIPMVMQGVANIAGASKGMYWDGAITDYHISLPYRHQKGIVLVPHFIDKIFSGWFDKKLPWYRRPPEENLRNVVLLAPSLDYIDSLPNKRISEMKDFNRFDSDQKGRANYWLEIAERSEELANDFDRLIKTGEIADRLQRI